MDESPYETVEVFDNDTVQFLKAVAVLLGINDTADDIITESDLGVITGSGTAYFPCLVVFRLYNSDLNVCSIMISKSTPNPLNTTDLDLSQ